MTALPAGTLPTLQVNKPNQFFAGTALTIEAAGEPSVKLSYFRVKKVNAHQFGRRLKNTFSERIDLRK